MQTKRRCKEIIWAVVFLLLTAWMIHFAATAFRPVQKTFGSTWSAFLSEPKDSLDVIYLGSSYAYCDVNPAKIYESSGLTSFVMAGGEQTLSLTYWYLKEILSTQSPAAVVLEGTGVFFNTYQNYTQKNISTMPVSFHKLGAILTAAEPELRQNLLFDLALYHDRWKDMERADFQEAFRSGWDCYKGYTPMVGTGVEEGDAEVVVDRTVDPQVYADNMVWLGKILNLCQTNNIQVIVTFHPSYTRCTAETYARIGQEIQSMNPNVIFCDWSADIEKIGLIPTEHFYDGGHLNQDGAALFSAWLGRELTEEFGLTPRSQTPENTAAWQQTVKHWNDLLAV